MSEYYAVQRSDKFLEHYGIRGMKWGVRKAVESRNSVRAAKKLSRQYAKASKKLAKLEKKADVNIQKAKAEKYSKIGKNAAGIAVSGGLMAAGGTALGKHMTNLAKKTTLARKMHDDRYNESASRLLNAHQNRFLRAHDKLLKSGASRAVRDKLGSDAENNFNKAYDKSYGEYLKTHNKLKSQFNTQADIARSGFSAAKVGSTMAGLGLLGAGVASAKAIAAKRRATEKGHTKAVAKRDAWKKEMQSAFKGTKYASLPKNTGTNRHGKKRRKTT